MYHQMSDTELNDKIGTFLSRKISGYKPQSSRPHEERELDTRKSLLTRLSEQYTLLVGNQPVFHR